MGLREGAVGVTGVGQTKTGGSDLLRGAKVGNLCSVGPATEQVTPDH